MIKTTLYIFAAIAVSCPTIYASERALAGYGLNCQHEQLKRAQITKIPEELEPFVTQPSVGYRLKLTMTTSQYKRHYSLVQLYPYISVILDDSSEFSQSETPSANSSSTTQPGNP